MRKILAGLAVLCVLATGAVGATWTPLSIAEGAGHGGATHMAVWTHADLTLTTNGVAQTFTNSITAGTAVEFVAMVLDVPFTCGTTNYTDSMLIKVGDGSDDDLFLASTELASDGSEVYAKFAPASAYTAVSTPTTVTTNLITLKAGATNVAQTVTNAVVKTLTVATANTAGVLGQKYYSVAGGIVTSLDPDANQDGSDFTGGEVRLYFRLFQTKR